MLWYAASLVPEVVVIDTGVRLLFISLLATLLSMAVASITLYWLRKWSVFTGKTKNQELEDQGKRSTQVNWRDTSG